MLGVPILFVDPAYTSQTCSRCREVGVREWQRFVCPHCGFTSHADLNAAFNILHRAEPLLSEPLGLGSGLPSTSPETQTVLSVMGKPSASADGS
jgi:transposase